MTSILWFRAMLKDLHGIEAADIEWYNLRDRGKETGLDKDPPKGVSITWLPMANDAVEMLENGTYDAVHGLSPGVATSPRVRVLFEMAPSSLPSSTTARTAASTPITTTSSSNASWTKTPASPWPFTTRSRSLARSQSSARARTRRSTSTSTTCRQRSRTRFSASPTRPA